jgi:HEAT repeat protein
MSIFSYIFNKSDKQPNTGGYLPDFDSFHEINQISSIYEWVLNPNRLISEKCAETVHRLLASKTAHKNKELYHSFRYIDIRTKDLDKFENFEKEIRHSLLCVASMNSDGYVREKALMALLLHPSQISFPFILFRLADWVPAVRSVAEQSVRGLIQNQDPKFLIQQHKIIDGLLKVGRTNLQDIHKGINESIFSKKSYQGILKEINTYDASSRLYIFRNLITRDMLDDQALEKILTDKNHLIRLLAIRDLDSIDKPEVLKKLLQDKSSKIRSYALNLIPKNHLSDFQSELSGLIFDNSGGIRAISPTLLSKVNEEEYHSRYKEEVLKKPSIGSIIGLSEVGNLDDLEILSSFLNSSLAKIKAAALYAIANLDYTLAKENSFTLLNDPSNTVKKACITIIPKEKFPEDSQKLRVIYSHGFLEVKLFTLKLISKYGGWSIAGDFIKGLNETDEKLNRASYAFLNKWYHYSIKLGTTQNKRDVEYVLNAFDNLTPDALDRAPKDITKILDEIPFIFKRE